MLNQSMILSLLFNDEQMRSRKSNTFDIMRRIFLYWYNDNVSLCLKYVEIKEHDSYEKLQHFSSIDRHACSLN